MVLKYTNANLYALDYCNAVDANYKNNGPNNRLRLFQAELKKIYFYNKGNGLSRLNRFVPISEMPEALKSCLNDKEMEEWMLLDTFDMFSPAYDKPQRPKKVKQWFIELDLINVEAEIVQYDKEMEAAVVRGTKA